MTRVHVVSDVHGNVADLARAGDGADALVVLGDLLNYVDYGDPSAGILGEVFGAEASSRFGRLRAAGLREEMVAHIQGLWGSLADPVGVLREAVHAQYARLFAALRAPLVVATPGNVDLPDMWPEFAGPGVVIVDGAVTEIGGLRWGFVGGTVLPPGSRMYQGFPWTPYVRDSVAYDAAVAGLSAVDVLASHVPPAVPELVYDVVARRAETGSTALLDVIHRDRPRLALFGHVHQPLAMRVRVGRTECVNVGHFRRTGTPHVLHL